MRLIHILICISIFLFSLSVFAKHLNQDVPLMRLGDGYSSIDHVSMGESPLDLGHTRLVYGDMQNSISLSQNINHTELSKQLNIDFSASGGWGQFSANALAHYLSDIQNTNYSENFSFFEKFYCNFLLDTSDLPSNLSALSQPAADLYSKRGVESFSKRYGNSFIRQLPMGAMLIANIKFNFNSASDKKKFNMGLGGNFGSIFNAKFTIQNAILKSNAKGVIEVSAYQLGGDPSALPNIFAKKGSGYYLTSCSFDHWSECQAAIDGIIDYAQNNFSKQIQVRGNNEKPQGNLAVVGPPTLASYTDKFNLAPAPKLKAALLGERIKLSNQYSQFLRDKLFIDHLLIAPIAKYYRPETLGLLQSLQTNLEWNLNLYHQLDVLQCYINDDVNDCAEIAKNIATFSKPIDQKSINYYRDLGYFDDKFNCMYVPIGHPQDDKPTFANYCQDRWISGVFSFKLNTDGSISFWGDYFSWKKLHHVIVQALLTPNSNQTFVGIGQYHDLDTNGKMRAELLMRRTPNNV